AKSASKTPPPQPPEKKPVVVKSVSETPPEIVTEQSTTIIEETTVEINTDISVENSANNGETVSDIAEENNIHSDEDISVEQIELEAENLHAATAHILQLRNPLTGEISKVPHSYPFAKRWIKEALVREGLLEKVYSNHELNVWVNAKTKKALATLKTMSNYQVD
ncbi:MAG: hypothetical protein RL637_64, partial [Pseudomonadota bacterium]